MPAQTRGFLFCDLRGYSAFVERHGDRAARDLLTRYRRSVRDVIGRVGGAEVRTEGDSFYVVFDSISQAVEAGLAIQATLAADTTDAPIRAGIGIHAGEVEDDAEQGIVSGAVNIAARICALAEPGEVLVSETVRGLTRGYLDVSFVPRGRRRLKGITEPVPVYRVGEAAGAKASRRPMSVGAAALAVLIIAAIAGGAYALSTARQGIGGLASTTGPATATRPVTASAPLRSESASAVPNAYPNSREQELLGRLPDDIAETCVRADDDEIPESPPRAYQRTPFPAVAAVRCRVTDRVNAFFFMAAGASAPEETVFHYAGRRGIQDRTCDDGQPGLEPWSFGPASGWVLCSNDALWTYEGSNILGRAISPDIETTMTWWRHEARFRGD